jgi:RimJ/RimL family protein N-acetyltransferase
MNAWESAPQGAAAGLAARIAAEVPVLETGRLRLRPPRLADFQAYACFAGSERARYIGGPMTREEAWFDFVEMAAGWLLRGHGLWAVERRDDGALVGFLPLHTEHGDPEPELGFLFLAEAEGRGYAFEAAEAARAFAFDRLGWSTVVSYVDPANARSIRLAERLGARAEGTEAEALVYRHRAGEARQ